MLKKLPRHLLGYLVLAVGVVVISGCATTLRGAPEDIVKLRAQAYWNARLEGQQHKAYELLSPSYRSLRTLEQYRSQFGSGVAITAASVLNVTCQPEACTVRVRLDAKPALMNLNLRSLPTYVSETWLREDGQWWRYQDL